MTDAAAPAPRDTSGLLGPPGPLGTLGTGHVAAALPIEELARVTGGYRFVELRLFEILGGWVASTPEVEAKLVLGALAPRHAWHAELWEERMPLDGAHAVPEGADRGTEAVLSRLAELPSATSPGGTAIRLVGLFRVVLPRLVAAYREHLRAVVPVSDGPIDRALRLVLADEVGELLEGEAVVQALLVDEQALALAAEHQWRLEAAALTSDLLRAEPLRARRQATLDAAGTLRAEGR
ncbi:MAG: hypothetical protein ACRDYD_02945 [Acidimicrobiales bacterium]